MSRTATEDTQGYTKGLARKLTCTVVAAITGGIVLILLLQVGLTLGAVPSWGDDVKDAMVELERENLQKLAGDKAEYLAEIFGRVKESMLQLQAFAAQALREVPTSFSISQYLMSYSGLGQEEDTWEHSVWYVTDGDEEESLLSNSTVGALLNRSSLMDLPFRSQQRQHEFTYLAALDDSSAPDEQVPDINFQMYPGFDLQAAGFQTHTDDQGCADERFTDYGDAYNPVGYDPRCRVWYQDAIAEGNDGVIFTEPYTDATTLMLIISVAAPVYDLAASGSVRGAAGLDMDITNVRSSVEALSVIEDEGYAYLLSPGGLGQVAVHRDLDPFGDAQYIGDLEADVDDDAFGDLVSTIGTTCSGYATYTRSGEPWILAWKHEVVTSQSGHELDDCSAGFVVVVTVSESALFQVFSKMESEVRNIVAVSSIIMALILIGISVLAGGIARILAVRIAAPVNQLIDVLHALNEMDFTRHPVGSWMINEVSSPEVMDLVDAFKGMDTTIKFANMSVENGDLDVALQNYLDAHLLFRKLHNQRGESIANNNLGNVRTLKAEELTSQAVLSSSKKGAAVLVAEAAPIYEAAVTNYRLAVGHAEMLCTIPAQRQQGPLPLDAESKTTKDDSYQGRASCTASDAGCPFAKDVEGLDSDAALRLQLANRKFNLARCLAAKGYSPAAAGDAPDKEHLHEARLLLWECIESAKASDDHEANQRHVEYLLELFYLEHRSSNRIVEARLAVDLACRVIADMKRNHSTPSTGKMSNTPQRHDMATTSSSPRLVLQQKVLVARGAQYRAEGNVAAAAASWTEAIMACGDVMDTKAMQTALRGIHDLASTGQHRDVSPSLLEGLNLSARWDAKSMSSAIDRVLTKLQRTHDDALASAEATSVDLCFVMDCTGSMQRWIDQAKNKLMDIVEQAKEDVGNVNVRVAFVGYRDFGDVPQYEGPYNFHKEEDLPSLLAELKKIKAFGGKDFPEDIAGGLKLAASLSWRSPVRLCMLIADAPCHGSMYHGCVGDDYPKGCPKGLDPTALLYRLQYELGADFYFVRITDMTDKMISIFRNQVARLESQSKGKRPSLKGTANTAPKFKVHDLGSDDNRFLETVVASVKFSMNLLMETY